MNKSFKLKPFVNILNANLKKLVSFTSWIKDKIQNSKDMPLKRNGFLQNRSKTLDLNIFILPRRRKMKFHGG